MSMGGWGLGAGREEHELAEDELEDEEGMDTWDQAQVRGGHACFGRASQGSSSRTWSDSCLL